MADTVHRVRVPNILLPKRLVLRKYRKTAKREAQRVKLDTHEPSPFMRTLRSECEQQLEALRLQFAQAQASQFTQTAADDLAIQAHGRHPLSPERLFDQGRRLKVIEAAIEETESNLDLLVRSQHTAEATYVAMLVQRVDHAGIDWIPPSLPAFETRLNEERTIVSTRLAAVERALGVRPRSEADAGTTPHGESVMEDEGQ